MEKTKKKKGSKPVELIKAFFGAAMLFCIPGLIITFIAPSFTIRLDRVSQERVDATVVKNILFLVPIFKETAIDLQNPESNARSGGVIREGNRSTGRVVGQAEDEGVLLLHGRSGIPIKVSVSPSSLDKVEEDILSFISESKEPSLRMWTVSNWKSGAFLPGGILLFSLIVFCMAAWSILTGKPLE
ncbi:hypothetical protein VU01_101914 [Candidatus Electrothrix marina]|uniref:Uncharacterized protein n=1 Tax=Candidatus Electrothrix marina TaxID=1859130 RepID=A0A444JGW0_9BACT|nr:hypothetical protein VU01_101914 [Candidatus Electrothrix marina]